MNASLILLKTASFKIIQKEKTMPTVIIDKNEMNLIRERLAAQIIERNPGADNLYLVGIRRRGADLAAQLASILEKRLQKNVPLGTLDINLYRDDWTRLKGGSPHIGSSSMPFSIDDKKILLIDDVLFSGRTVRAALEALLDYGRPESVELLVFIDRGHRELPVCANYVGRKIGTEKEEHIDVLFESRDGRDGVILT